MASIALKRPERNRCRSNHQPRHIHKALAVHRQAILEAYLIFHIDFARTLLGIVQLAAFGGHAHPAFIHLERRLPSPAVLALHKADIAIQHGHCLWAELGHLCVRAVTWVSVLQHSVSNPVVGNTVVATAMENTVFNTLILHSE